MKPVASPLNILDFAIMNLEFSFVQSKKRTEADLRQYFNEYDIDIDFSIHSNDVLQVFITAKVNRAGERLPGYSILAEAACIFEFNKNIAITKETKNSIEGFSTIYIALNVLRGFISQITASAPLGKYILPSIDLNDLIAQKKNGFSDSKPVPKKRAAAKKK